MSSLPLTWTDRFAARWAREQGGGLQQILSLANVSDVISFAGGFPEPETFPLEAVLDGLRELVQAGDTAAFQYSPVEGLPGPRDYVANRIGARDGFRPKSDQLILTSGGMEGLSLVAATLLDPDDAVVIEAPTYLGAIMAFRASMAELRTVTMDRDGLRVEELEGVIAAGHRPKLLYTIPDHHNPMGVSLSLERRRALIELARKYGFLIVEDVAYRELYFDRAPLQSLWSLAPDLTLQLGTFSKTFLPGFRLGWALGPPSLIRGLVNAKQLTDQCAGAVGQRLLEWYGRSGHMDRQLEKSRALYRRRRDLLLTSLAHDLEYPAKWTKPEGGFFSWLTLDPTMDTRQLAVRAREANVAFVPGGAFYPDSRGCNELRLSYSCVADADVSEGIRRLGQVLRESINLGRRE